MSYNSVTGEIPCVRPLTLPYAGSYAGGWCPCSFLLVTTCFALGMIDPDAADDFHSMYSLGGCSSRCCAVFILIPSLDQKRWQVKHKNFQSHSISVCIRYPYHPFMAGSFSWTPPMYVWYLGSKKLCRCWDWWSKQGILDPPCGCPRFQRHPREDLRAGPQNFSAFFLVVSMILFPKLERLHMCLSCSFTQSGGL